MSSLLVVELDTLPAKGTPGFVGTLDTSHQASSIVLDGLTSDPGMLPLVESENSSLSNRRMVVIIATLSGVNLLSSISTGLLTVGLPRMAADIELPTHLLLWPSSVYALTSGSCLLLAGSIADVMGNRLINLTGCFVVGCFIIACGLARSGIELIMFRALQGIAVSLCLPTSVAIVANSTPSGRKRNIGFSCLGFVQPIGFSLGLVLEGILLDTAGWRLGFYLCGGLTLTFLFVSLWALPEDRIVEGSNITRLKKEIDWVGATIACTCLSLFSYVLATLTSSISNIQYPVNISMLAVSVALVPAFILWESRQERLRRPALIPNSLWKNTVFTSICLMVIFSFAVVNAMELFCSLFFQEVQNLSALQASIRILPSLIVGAALQLTTGLLIHRVPAFYLVLLSLILNAGAPLLMALIDAQLPYWYNAFFAQLLAPLSADILFTIGLLVVSEVFPTSTQALAGAVFNTVAQFGTSIGLTVMAVISSSATAKSGIIEKSSPNALMVGYRASFWAAFAWMALACIIAAFGLRRIGKVGLKRD